MRETRGNGTDMKVLVLTSAPISAEELRNALGTEAADDAEVMVVAPALQESGVKFWMSDADAAIARAEEVRKQTVEQLGSEGVQASGDTGESDPMYAIQDALQTFPAERIVVFASGDDDGGYREDIDPREVEERFGVPTTRATP
jgi:hypothetical protein